MANETITKQRNPVDDTKYSMDTHLIYSMEKPEGGISLREGRTA